MISLFSRLIDYMEEEEMKYEILEGETIIRFNFKVASGRLLCYGEVDERKNWLTFYSYLPVNGSTEKMADLGEFITRANRGMRIGNFELDFDDGEIRYKTSIDVEGGELTHKMIDNLLRANLSTINRYFNGLMELIYSDKSARDLIARIETPVVGALDDAETESIYDDDDSDLDDDDDSELDDGESEGTPFRSEEDDDDEPTR